MKKRLFVLCSFVFVLSACSPADKYDTGYKDGYATGYNTTCKIRATIIEADWGNESYSKGYHKGYEVGSIACKNKN